MQRLVNIFTQVDVTCVLYTSVTGFMDQGLFFLDQQEVW